MRMRLMTQWPKDVSQEGTARMVEALWSVDFASSLGTINGGIVVLEDGCVRGGDGQYLYTGSYRYACGNNILDASIRVKEYRAVPDRRSIFGLGEVFHLKLRGTVARGHMKLSGAVMEKPELDILLVLNRQEELP
jgi:hypothetical protein